MLPYSMIAGGKFTVSVTGGVAKAVQVECQSQNPPDFIIARSISGWGEVTDAQALEWWWERSMSQGQAKGLLQSSAAAVGSGAVTTVAVASGGISTYDTANPPSFAAIASSDIALTTFIATVTSSATFAVGDYVRVTLPVNMFQISGYVFQITAIPDATHITLGYMATAATAGLTAFAANADTANIERIIPNRMYPRWAYIAFISKVAEAKVYFTAKNDFTPGEIVSFRVSSDFGMEEINNKQVRVLSVTNTATESSITIDLDTSGYTTFVFPDSATAEAGITPAVVVPSSSGVVPFNGSATIPQQPPGTNLLDAFDNRNVRVINFGAGLFNFAGNVSDDLDVWMWQAYKYDDYKSTQLS